MYNVNDLFYKPEGKDKHIEGYLGDSNECEILFVLREPHEDNQQEFWFKNAIDKEPKERDQYEKKYILSLGTLAYKLLGGNDDSPCVCKLEEALRKCAYINIYPFSGESSSSIHYDNTLVALKDVCTEEIMKGPVVLKESDRKNHCYRRIAANRLQIIQNLNWKILVTVCGAFETITNLRPNDCPVGITVGYKSGKKPDKEFRIAHYNDSARRIVSFYHPSHSCACNVENKYLNIPDCLILSNLDS